MPHLKSAKRRLRQSNARNLRNRAVKADLKTTIKKLLKALKDHNVADSKSQLQVCFSKLDKCAARRYLHPNTAHRYKSRLANRVKHLESGAAASAS